MLKIRCFRCEEELKEQGGLLFAPPVKGKSRKIHLCLKCYRFVLEVIMPK